MVQHKKIDYSFKARVLNMGLDVVERQASLRRFKNKDCTEYNELTCQYSDNGKIKEWQEAIKINHASYERRKRLEKRITKLLIDNANGVINECSFLTLTFTDNVLKNTDYKQRRDRVSRYLKSQCLVYVANIDFGSKNGREHYHAIVQSQNIDFAPWRKNGNINAKKIILRNGTSVKLAKYIAKLTNHGIKETTHRQALIYSR